MAVDVNANPFGDETLEFPTAIRTEHQGSMFTRQADGRWLDEWGNELTKKEGKIVIVQAQIEAWRTHSLARWANQIIPEQQWFMQDWIPDDQVVGLYGTPGSRKSTLLLQLMIPACLGKGFGPCEKLLQAPCYGLFCEDSEKTIARRARAILKGYNASFEDMIDCHPESLVEAKLTHFFTFTRSGVMRPTPAWEKFTRDLDRINPGFVVLDVAANFFAGNEISRTETTMFLRRLDQMANERKFGLVFSAHPSLRGVRDRTLSSGSTGWEGGVRARMTIGDPTDNDDENSEDIPNRLPNQSDQRTLTLVKSNYARAGATIDLICRDGFFFPADLDPDNKKTTGADHAAAERQFLDRLKAEIQKGRYVSPSKATPVYAPAKLAGNGFTVKTLETAMNRLFDRGVLKFNSKNKSVDRWIIAE